MKKLIILVLLSFTMFITGCSNNGNHVLDKAYENLSIGDTTKVTSDLTLPTKDGDVVISWQTSDAKVITTSGKVTRPAFDSSDAKVKLTASLSHEGDKKDKEFNVTVLKEAEAAKPSADVIAFADTTVSAGIKISIVPNNENFKVYYAVVAKTTATYTDEEVKLGTHADFVSSGNKVGGYVAYSVSQLTENTTYNVLVLVEDTTNNVLGRVDAVEVTSSASLFFNGEDYKELGYLPIYNLRDLEEYARGYGVEYGREINIKLMNDIDMSQEYGEGKKNWKPLDAPNTASGQDGSGTEFIGTFDGNGKTINGFYCHSSLEFVGLYRKVDLKHKSLDDPSATFKDLTFTNVDVKATFDPNEPTSSSGTVYSARGVGVLAGYFRGGTISNVKVIGGTVSHDATLSTASSQGYIGGLIGWAQPNGFGSGLDDRGDVSMTIENCMTNIDVIAPKGNNVGGLVGRMDESTSGTPWNMTIKNCYTLGNTSGRAVVGGIIGAIRGTIENCVAYGEVNYLEGSTDVGGIAGNVENLRRPGYENWNTSITNVAYMGTSNVNVVVFAGDKDESGNYTNHQEITHENLYLNSANGFVDSSTATNKPVVTSISYDDFINKTGVQGFELWAVETIGNKKYLLPQLPSQE